MSKPKPPPSTSSPAEREGSVRIFTKEMGEKEGYLEIPFWINRHDESITAQALWEQQQAQKRKSSLCYVMRSWATTAWTRLRHWVGVHHDETKGTTNCPKDADTERD